MGRKFLAMLFVIVLVVTSIPDIGVQAKDLQEDEIPSTEVLDSGKCGDNLTYTLDAEETLTISGTGRIEDGAFYNYYKAKKLVIEEGVTAIGDGAFSLCCNLESISLPDSLVEIGDSVFYEIGESIKSIYIPKNVLYIGDKLFYSCYTFSDFIVDEENPCYSAVDGVLFNKDKSCLVRYPEGRMVDYVVPEGVTVIDDYAFAHCKGVENITISSEVTSIGINAFEDCYATTIHCPYVSYAHIYAQRNNLLYRWTDTEDITDMCLVVFDLDGGDIIGQPCRGVKVGEAIGKLPEIRAYNYTTEHENLVFNGWFTEAEGGVRVTEDTVVNENMTVYGQWKKKNTGESTDSESEENKEDDIADKPTGDENVSSENNTQTQEESDSVREKYSEVNSYYEVHSVGIGKFYCCRASSVEGYNRWLLNPESQVMGYGYYAWFIEHYLEKGYLLVPSGKLTGLTSTSDDIYTHVGLDNFDLGISIYPIAKLENIPTASEDIEDYMTVEYDMEKEEWVWTGCTYELKSFYNSLEEIETKNGKKKCIWQVVKYGDSVSQYAFYIESGTMVRISCEANDTIESVSEKVKTLSFEVVPIEIDYTSDYVLDGGVNDSGNPQSVTSAAIEAESKTDPTMHAKKTKVTKPAKVKISKATLTGKKKTKSRQLKLKWKKVSGAKGYEILYHSGKGFKKAKKITTTSTSRIIKSLKKGKRYYVKIRAYKLDSAGKKVYGKYSLVKKIN